MLLFLRKAGGGAGNFLVKVDKRTGEEVDKLLMDNTKPIYDIDWSTNAIIYVKDSDLMIYD